MTANPTLPLAGKSALVTGASSDLGLAIAADLAHAGAAVGYATLPEKCKSLQSRLQAESASPIGVYGLDLREPITIERTVEQFLHDAGYCDLLVNNAGVRVVAPSLSMSPAEWSRVLDINTTGPFLMSQAVASTMRQSGGAIVNVASQLGVVVARDRAAYCASKAALIHLTRSLALDWSQYAIRVNCVSPGVVDTVSNRFASTDMDAAQFLSKMPIGRPIAPAEVARCVRFLGTEESGAITGHNLVVDGGWTLA